MAALDFPNAPTVGQQFNASNGAVYTWDGAVWSLGGPASGQPAGGDLSGTYPNPTVTATAKSKWLTSGATITPTDATKQVAIPGPSGTDQAPIVMNTTRTIKSRVVTMPALDFVGTSLNLRWDGSAWQRDDTSKPASIWYTDAADSAVAVLSYTTAGVSSNPLIVRRSDGKTVCTLADTSVTRPMTAVNAAWQGFTTAGFTVNGLWGADTWVSIGSVGMTTRGGLVLVAVNLNAHVFPATTDQYTHLSVTRDGTMAGGGVGLQCGMKVKVRSTGSPGTVAYPIPGGVFFDQPAAGAHTWYCNIYVTTGCSLQTTDWAGGIQVLELS